MTNGIVAQTFKNTCTKILTPSKIYDPNNEFDEEYFEFGLFMSRREYKVITRRLHLGIISAVKEGKFVAGTPPYGYKKIKLEKQKGYSLIPDEDTYKNVQLIFNLYANGTGIKALARQLLLLNIYPRRSKTWSTSALASILTNPVYIGIIEYIDKRTIKRVVNGQVQRIKNEHATKISVPGLHQPIIDKELWDKVQEIRKSNLMVSTNIDTTIKNPMAGILKCSLCGATMERLNKGKRNHYVRITCLQCRNNVSSKIDLVEEKLLDSLKLLLEDYKLKIINNDNSDMKLLMAANSTSIIQTKKELDTFQAQLTNTYDLLEQGLYDKSTFIDRSNFLKSKINDSEKKLKELLLEKDKFEEKINSKKDIVPKIQNVIDTYYETDDAKQKNLLLKSVLQKVEYTKTNPRMLEDFQLVLFPKL